MDAPWTVLKTFATSFSVNYSAKMEIGQRRGSINLPDKLYYVSITVYYYYYY